jgi:hypothetical protein
MTLALTDLITLEIVGASKVWKPICRAGGVTQPSCMSELMFSGMFIEVLVGFGWFIEST